MNILETPRLLVRRITEGDAAFVLRLLNEPSWIEFIGDKGVRTLDDARAYITKGPVAMYERLGFGLYLAEIKGAGVPIGMCGLIKRDGLNDIDIGFAFLPAYWSKGYAYEAASAVVEHGRRDLGLRRIVAITTPHNQSSIKLLKKLGFVFEKTTRLSEDKEELFLFSCDVERRSAASAAP